MTADQLAGRLRDLANGPVDEHLAELLHKIADDVSALSALKPAAPSVDKCARCGYPRKEHSYNGACYGICGEFIVERDTGMKISGAGYEEAEETNHE